MADRLPTLAQALGNHGGSGEPQAPGKLPTLKQALSGNSGAVVVPAKKKGGGGVLGWVGHEVGQTGSDLYHAAVDAPAGLYETAKGLATHPVKTVEAYGHALASDVEHPLRHPGYTLLDLLGALDAGAGTAARLGAASAELGAGASVADAARALVKHPDYGTRTLKTGDLEVHPETSRSAVGATVQHAADKLLQTAADKNPGGRAADLLNRKIGKVNSENARMAEQIAKGPGAALIALGKKLKPGEQKALQVVAEQAPLEGRITATSARIVGAKSDHIRASHQAELGLLHDAREHLVIKDGKPALVEPKLQKVYDRMAKVAGDRETLLRGLGMLTDEAVGSRTAKAARSALGQPLEHVDEHPPAIKGQLSLVDEPKPDLFTPDSEAVRIPDVATKGRGSRGSGSFGRVGAQGTIGHLKAPGSVTHEYTAALREQGLRREDTTRLVGESSLESAKYAGLQHIHQLVRQAAQAEPTRPDDIAVRLDGLKSSDRLPLDVRKFVDSPEDFLHHATPSEAASVLDKVRAQLFINPRELSGEDAARFQQLHAEGKIGFVPKRILGDLAKPQAPLSAVAGTKAVRTVDAINNGSRFAMLYLKPAYALPNLLGNAALNVLQQGFAAVPNLTRAARLNAKLGEDATARLDTVMGEGFAQAISSHGQGALHAAVDKAASVWSKGVDTPFRRSAFLYEARQAGFKTPDQLDRLLTDPAHEPKLAEVAQRANREIIDYSNLTPAEREIVRRVIYFYPWIKGSTVYAGRLLKEHPIKAAAIGQLGRQGNEQTSSALGPIPSYLEGVFPVGKHSLVNPNSAAILQTPAQVGEAIAGLATGNIPQAAEASGFFTPALTLALAEALRKNPSTGLGYKGGTNAASIAQDVLGGQLPQVSLYRNLHAAIAGHGGSKLYPPSVRSALLQFLIGGIAPRQYDQQDLNRLARNEQASMKSGR